MPDKRPIDDLEKIRPESPENGESKTDESKAILIERLSSLNSAHKELKSKHKKERFTLIYIAAILFLLFIEKEEAARGGIIILTALVAVLIFLNFLAAWAGFRAIAKTLKELYTLIFKRMDEQIGKNDYQITYEELPDEGEKT